MITKEMIERINELANKKKVIGLEEDELEEQLALRAVYLESFRKNFREQLDGIEIVDDDKNEFSNEKGENNMKKDKANLGYDNAEALGELTEEKKSEKDESISGVNSGYDEAGVLEEENKEEQHDFMGDSSHKK
jgi:uncharacterized protein YnzC (UPF0291/DUF896 family)